MTGDQQTDAAGIVAEFPRDWAETGREWYIGAYEAWADAAESAGAEFDESVYEYFPFLHGEFDPDTTAAAVRVGETWYALVLEGDIVRLVPADACT
ncbi:hypothetical protein [Amycolatopsis sp. NPDC004079]|uniref:hypothetical protein n=1 Tax=Amycolatopsis sp. NPDC004079 TaxID=3154549 RepID=UPI0033B1923F